MAKATQVFDHDSPSAPTRAGGMLLGASGVTHPPVQTIGNLLALGSANGQFSDTQGIGDIASHAIGTQRYLIVADRSNTRFQFFTEQSDGSWLHLTNITTATLLGIGHLAAHVVVDTIRQEIHFGSHQFDTISVYALSDWLTWSSGVNRLRTYALPFQAARITVRGEFTYSASSGTRIKYNHVTNSLVTTLSQTGPTLCPIPNADNTKLWSGNRQTTGTIRGLHRIDTTTLVSSAKVDQNLNPTYRPETGYSDVAISMGVCHGGRLYTSYERGPLIAWSEDGAWLGEFAWPGGARIDATYGHWQGGVFNTTTPSQDLPKWAIVPAVDSSQTDLLVYWCSNASQPDNRVSGDQAYLTIIPITISKATWTKTDWSAGTNTLQGVALDGVNLSAEKVKVRLRKNAGAYVTLVAGQFTGSAFTTAISGLGTFTAGDSLTVELSLSTWDRLDGHATLYATRDKLSPVNVSAELLYNDSVADVYVPYASAAFKGKLGGTGAFKGKVGG